MRTVLSTINAMGHAAIVWPGKIAAGGTFAHAQQWRKQCLKNVSPSSIFAEGGATMADRDWPTFLSPDKRNRSYPSTLVPRTGGAAAMLMTAIRWRGFPLEQQGAVVRLAACADASDASALAEIFSSVGLESEGKLLAAGGLDLGCLDATLSKTGGDATALVEHLLNFVVPSGDDGRGHAACETWRWYSQEDFGRSVATTVIEPGVCMLVQAFNAVAAYTGSSCEGHGFGQRTAVLGFVSEFAQTWARFVSRLLDLGDSDWFFGGRNLWVRRKNDAELLCQGVRAAEKIFARRQALLVFRSQTLHELHNRPSSKDFEAALWGRAADLALAASVHCV